MAASTCSTSPGASAWAQATRSTRSSASALTDTGQPGGVHRLPQPGSPALDAASAAACPALSSLCLGAPAPEVTVDTATDATPTFGVFVNAGGAVPFDPAFNRVFVFFKDAGGAIRGSTSVAVRTL